jgi:hypothetical protein
MDLREVESRSFLASGANNGLYLSLSPREKFCRGDLIAMWGAHDTDPAK